MQTEKTAAGLSKVINFSYEGTNGKNLADGLDNISRINRMLESCIRSYLKCHQQNRYVVQFDQLDDNYTTYTDNDNYFQAIISLFKAIYDINQTFRRENILTKAIAYLRSDIFYSIDSFDAESARWDRFKLHLNWSIVNQTDWSNPRLLRMLNKRIESSLPEYKGIDGLRQFFDIGRMYLIEGGKLQDVFQYIIHRSFHRPRDVVQFCIKIQDEVNKTGKLYFRTIRNAEKEYSLWLLSEVLMNCHQKLMIWKHFMSSCVY